jgi:ABC-type Fe3+/spermidine/putrescine transport system ATPase subunit
VLNGGRVHQIDSPREIYERPATKFVADFIGRNNVIEALVESVTGDSAVIRFANGSGVNVHPNQKAADVTLTSGTRVGVCVRAESLRFSASNGFCTGELVDVEYSGVGFSCVARTDLGNLRIEVPGSIELPAKGQSVQFAVNESALHLVKPS